MLTVGHSHNVKFKVNVMGTATVPRVRVILGTLPEVSFPAAKEGDDWVAQIVVPPHVDPGEYDLRVEVLLNNRMFTPVNKRIGVLAAEPTVVIAPAEVEQPSLKAPDEVEFKAPASPVAPTPRDQDEPKLAAEIPLELPRKPLLKSFVPDEPVKKPIVKPVRIESKPFTKPAPQEPVKMPAADLSLGALAGVATAPVKKRFAPISSGMPSKVAESKPVKVSISEINASATKVTKTVVQEAPKKPAAKVAKKPAQNVKLIKEHLFYE